MTDGSESSSDRVKALRQQVELSLERVPWMREVGFKLTTFEAGRVVGVQPFSEHLIGDTEAKVIHGGAITTMLDNICGMACTSRLQEFRFVSTLDLRTDYMRPAESGRPITGEAECYHLTKSVAFARAWAYHDTKDKLIAMAQAAFAINKPPPTNTAGEAT